MSQAAKPPLGINVIVRSENRKSKREGKPLNRGMVNQPVIFFWSLLSQVGKFVTTLLQICTNDFLIHLASGRQWNTVHNEHIIG